MPRTLYFDLDGTVVHGDFGKVKPKLADGRLEAAIRQAGIERLVCVANICTIVTALIDMGRDADGHDMIFQLCQGAFRDEAWFRSSTALIPDGSHRARYIDFSGDWWWVDDRAQFFLDSEGLSPLAEQHRERRLMIPQPDGDGSDVIAWLESIPSCPA